MPKTVTVTKQQTSRRPLLDYEDAAEYTGLREKYLRRLVAEKRIPHVKMSPGRTGRIFFDPDKLDEWIASHAVPVDS
jgi:excisionase family DNA binding protein